MALILQPKGRVPIVCGCVSRLERSVHAAGEALHQCRVVALILQPKGCVPIVCGCVSRLERSVHAAAEALHRSFVICSLPTLRIARDCFGAGFAGRQD